MYLLMLHVFSSICWSVSFFGEYYMFGRCLCVSMFTVSAHREKNILWRSNMSTRLLFDEELVPDIVRSPSEFAQAIRRVLLVVVCCFSLFFYYRPFFSGRFVQRLRRVLLSALVTTFCRSFEAIVVRWVRWCLGNQLRLRLGGVWYNQFPNS